jgi:Cof subfamily protein (haloacid dehalogenase superfamily)
VPVPPPSSDPGREGRAVRLVATDLDGTLLDADGRVTPRTAAAVAAARDAGIHVVPVTGRPPQAMWPVLEGIGLGPYAVCSNGAVTVDMVTGAVIEEQTLPVEIATDLVARIRKAVPGIRFATDNLDRFCYERDFFSEPNAWDEVVAEVVDITQAFDRGCVKIICRQPGTSALDLIAALEAHVGEEGHVTSSGLDWVDIGAPGVTKAYALEKVCALLDIHVDDVVAVGDNHNDLSVLGWAGTAMAPSNAVPAVLAMVDRILPAHHDHGVAVLLEELASSAPPAGT